MPTSAQAQEVLRQEFSRALGEWKNAESEQDAIDCRKKVEAARGQVHYPALQSKSFAAAALKVFTDSASPAGGEEEPLEVAAPDWAAADEWRRRRDSKTSCRTPRKRQSQLRRTTHGSRRQPRPWKPGVLTRL